MPWEPPQWARSAEELSDRWLGTCRKMARHEQFFESLGWPERLGYLFAVACVREAYARKLNKRSQELLELLERYADGSIPREELTAVSNANFDEEAEKQKTIIHPAASTIACTLPQFAAGYCATQKPHREKFGKILAAMIGPGWSWSDQWRTESVVSVARGIYDERAWGRMPILADALIDAGCQDARVRVYCRGTGPFFRGCWVLDQALKKRE